MELNKIYQGDCLELMLLIAKKSIDMILCDLPYGTTACKWDNVIPFESLWLQYKRIIRDNGAIVLTASQPFTTDLINSNRKWFKYCWIWNKQKAGNFAIVKYQPLRITEDICIFSKDKTNYYPQRKIAKEENKRPRDRGYKKKTDIFSGFKSNLYSCSVIHNEDLRWPTNVIDIKSTEKECNQLSRVHPTQKPVALFEYLIKTYTNEGDLVLDNCIGSGTTAIACMQTNRNFIGMELEPKYVEITNKRIEDFTKQLVLV